MPEEPELDTREIDNQAVRESQVARLKQIRASRDGKRVAAALEALTNASSNGQGNLLALGIEAARRHTVPSWTVSTGVPSLHPRHPSKGFYRKLVHTVPRDVIDTALVETRYRA